MTLADPIGYDMLCLAHWLPAEQREGRWRWPGRAATAARPIAQAVAARHGAWIGAVVSDAAEPVVRTVGAPREER